MHDKCMVHTKKRQVPDLSTFGSIIIIIIIGGSPTFLLLNYFYNEVSKTATKNFKKE